LTVRALKTTLYDLLGKLTQTDSLEPNEERLKPLRDLISGLFSLPKLSPARSDAGLEELRQMLAADRAAPPALSDLRVQLEAAVRENPRLAEILEAAERDDATKMLKLFATQLNNALPAEENADLKSILADLVKALDAPKLQTSAVSDALEQI